MDNQEKVPEQVPAEGERREKRRKSFAMPEFLTVSPSPHIKNQDTPATVMFDVLVALTPKGEALASEKNREAVDFHSRLMSQLDPSEAQQFLDMIERMISIIDCDGPQPPS